MKADLFCWPWESGCRADGKIGTSGNNAIGGARDGFVVYVRNNTGKKIYVTFRGYVYRKPESNCSYINSISECGGFDGFKNFGTYVFQPGERAMILNGRDNVVGRNAIFSAYDRDGSQWNKQVDMGDSIGSFEFTFN